MLLGLEHAGQGALPSKATSLMPSIRLGLLTHRHEGPALAIQGKSGIYGCDPADNGAGGLANFALLLQKYFSLLIKVPFSGINGVLGEVGTGC